MTICYGPFLLRRVPIDAIETEAQALDALNRFASLGFCSVFREIIEDQVVEFSYDSKTRTASHCWLKGADADAIHQLNTLDRFGNCVPASWMATVAGMGPVLIPGARGRGHLLGRDTSLELETGEVIRFSASGAYSASDRIRDRKFRVEYASEERFKSQHDPRDSRHELIDFYKELMLNIDRCRKAKILYILGEL